MHTTDSYPQFCARVFRTPHSFYRHKCMNEWNIERTLWHFASALQTGAITASRDNCAASNPFQIYTQLPPPERDMLLKCLGCGKSFSYISGLVSHFKVCTYFEICLKVESMKKPQSPCS